jgi:hypothetical protein
MDNRRAELRLRENSSLEERKGRKDGSRSCRVSSTHLSPAHPVTTEFQD